MNKGSGAVRTHVYGASVVVLAAAVISLVAAGSPAVAAVATAGTTAVTADDSSSLKSGPPDRKIYPLKRKSRPRGGTSTLSSAGVYTIDPSLSSSSAGGSEPSIAVNPANPNEIAITRFTLRWNSNADMLFSTNGGITWTNQSTIPAPPGVAGTAGCPCDQTIDFGLDGTLYGTFLTCTPGGGGCSATSVVSGSTTNPASAASWTWNGNPAQLTSGSRTNVDQPWLLTNRDPTNAGQTDVYVAYDNFGGAPDARVAGSFGASPVNFTVDNIAGTESPLTTNPGLRLAADPSNGTMYAVYEQSSGASQPKSVTYRLNRSTDGGATWTLNGDANGLVVDTVNSDQAPGFKFGGVNALLGGVDHAAVDPGNGDVYVVYGQDVSGSNQIKIRRLTDNGSGGLNVGAVHNVSTSTDAALPSVAVLTDGTIGVLYVTHDGSDSGGFPTFSAHLARSTDHGSSFSDVVFQSFSSPAKDDGTARQRVFGDYIQMKAVGNTFYGVYSGNRNGFGSTTSAIDPIFFSVPQATQTTVTSSANPSVFTQPVSFTATVTPVPDGGTVSFQVDGSPLGGPVPVNTVTGTATSISTSSLAVGSHPVVAIYSGNANFAGSTGTLTQVVNKSPTTTTYTGPTTSDFHDAFTASATLTGFGGAPLAGKLLTFVLGAGTGTETCSALTDGSGIAQCSLTPNEAAGLYTLTASFAGDGSFLGSSNSVPFTITKEETALHYTGPTLIPNGQNVSFSALLKEDDVVPIAGRTVTITIGSGGTAQSCNGVTNGAGIATCSILVSQPLGPGLPIHAAFAGDPFYLPSSDDATALVFAFLDHGTFAVGNGNAAIGTAVTFWGAEWAGVNTLSGGPAPASFKGFAGQTTTSPPSCGTSYTARPGNSGNPPTSVPSFMAVAVSSKLKKSGSTITGDIIHIVIVRTDAGYGPNPGHKGTGTIVAQFC
jgi:hypothetical protein